MPNNIESTSMAGYVQERIQDLPKKSINYKFDDLTFRVLDLNKHTIKKVRITLANDVLKD